MRSPYTPLSTTSSALPAGTADAIAASTAAVPEPANSTAVKSVPAPASATSRSRQRRIISKHSGSRWQRSSITSACLTVWVVFAGPGFRRIHITPGPSLRERASDEGLELLDTREIVERERELTDDGPDSIEIDRVAISGEQALDVGTIAVAPRHRLIDDEVFRGRDLDRD